MRPLTLFSSRKFWIALVSIGVVSALAFAGQLAGVEAMEFVKWVVTAMIAAIAGEDIAGRIVDRVPKI